MVSTNRWLTVWQRNFRVWRKLFIPSMLGNFLDPLIYLLALGYGLGVFVGKIDGMPYLVFLASGIICSSAMNATTFEGLFSAYTRMSIQKTWDGMLTAPLSVADVVVGEGIWAATKGVLSASPILIVAALMGLIASWQAIWAIPVIFLMSIGFAGIALIVTTWAKSYDFFTYYFTLLVTPMMLLSGVFFPVHTMPKAIQIAAQMLPLYHAVELVRPLSTHSILTLNQIMLHFSVLTIYAVLTLYIAVIFARRRLIN